jgi:hypothetical protein
MISKEEKLKIKSIVDSGAYFSDDGIMDIADEIVPEHIPSKQSEDQTEQEKDMWHSKWLQAHKIAWDYVTYKEELEDAISRVPDNPMKELENKNG